MRFILLSFIAALLTTSCASHAPTKITRFSVNPWEKDIGYAEVVQAGNSFYISGVVCSGANYQIAVASCYKDLREILIKLQLPTKNIVKENVYARDIEQFKLQIPQRKDFYGNDNYPAATWIQVDRFFLPEHLVEIELIVVK
jgi:enamine deaminase RidA (YjgF/YER057c/UK114 family)